MSGMPTYEQLLNQNHAWALREGSMHFERESAVHKALEKVAHRLNELHIPYAVVGGMALFFHGYRRFTEDVDILVTKDGLKQIHEHLEGPGWVQPFAGSKQLRDAEFGVKIEFLLTGDFPGDGLPKPVAFPDPSAVGIEGDCVRYLSLPTLIELKLASGISNPRRGKDIVDVQQLIETLGLTQDFADQLNPFVQAKFRELCDIVRDNPP